MKKIFSVSLCLCGLLFLLALSPAAQVRDYTRWVDPFIGTGGHGHTFPGAVLPFGMVQLSPDTRGADWDGSSGYHYSDDIIYGFSHTHLSGTGIPDGCDILFMPTVAPFFEGRPGGKDENGYASRFSHTNEKAEPGYYSVKLDDDNILAELTATARVGIHRYTFPQTDRMMVVLDVNWRDKLLGSEISVVSNRRIEGYRRSTSWAKDQTVYFVAEFSKPFKAVFQRPPTDSGPNDEVTNKKAIFSFHSLGDNQVQIKVALSSVSIEGARKNLAAELPGWDFDKVRSDARDAWNKELSKIEVSGGTDAQTRTFYTALYHTMIHPSIFNDVDGNYRGMDGKVHNIADDAMQRRGEEEKRSGGANPKPKIQNLKSDQYTVFSLWDTFRAEHPLLTIIDQKRTADFINTFIRQYEQGGRLPVWELWGNETDTMIGYHAVSVIADAMAKGIKGFDYEKAYSAAKHSAELDREGLAAYKRRGYISQEDSNESVSKTLEYAYDDWCIGEMAGLLATRYLDAKNAADISKRKRFTDEGIEFFRRASSFENLFDPETGFMRPKVNGGFARPFAPNEVTFNYTEGNAWVYSFFVPHKLGRLIELQGGKDKFAAKLDELFTTTDKLTGRDQPDITGLIGQYAHGNEPSHHIAYLYDSVDQPWKTQLYTRKIMDEFYKALPDGLIGNEDCGQMSAWYVLSASGFYPSMPVSLSYNLGTPLFPEIKFHLENGRTFTVRAPSVSDRNIYIKSAKLNGYEYTWAGITHDDIMGGGLLELNMSAAPVKTAFKPTGYFNDNRYFVAVPIIGDGRRTFRESYSFAMKSITPEATVFYTLDGSEPNERSMPYVQPVTITADTTVRAIAINGKGVKSQMAEATYKRISNDWTVKIDSKYSTQYTAGGDSGLIDGIRGTTNFTSEWQGYQGQDFVATVDLQKETTVGKVGSGFLQSARSWIWMPTHVEFEVSTDGVNFTRVADIKTDVAPEDMDPQTRDYVQTISPVTARYVRVHAYNLGKIPAWHPGAGGDAWIFVDEILIN